MTRKFYCSACEKGFQRNRSERGFKRKKIRTINSTLTNKGMGDVKKKVLRAITFTEGNQAVLFHGREGKGKQFRKGITKAFQKRGE